jgi:thioredoxin 2
MKGQNMQILACDRCGARNRVDLSRGQPICGKCKIPLRIQTTPVVLTEGNFALEVEHTSLPVLVDFWAAWCGPCRIVAPVIDELARELAGRVKVCKLDVDQNPVTASRFGVQSIPTMLILQNGREVDRLVGAQPKRTILSRLSSYIK